MFQPLLVCTAKLAADGQFGIVCDVAFVNKIDEFLVQFLCLWFAPKPLSDTPHVFGSLILCLLLALAVIFVKRAHHSARHSCRHRVGGNILRHQRACTDDAVVAYRHTFQHNHVGTEIYVATNRDVSRRIHKVVIRLAEHRAGPVMRKQLEIVIEVDIATYRHQARSRNINPNAPWIAEYNIISYFYPPDRNFSMKRALLLV